MILKLEVTKTSKEFWIPTSKFIALKNVPIKKNIMFLEPLNSLMKVQFAELVFTLVLLQMIKVEKCIFLLQMMYHYMIKKIKIQFKLKNWRLKDSIIRSLLEKLITLAHKMMNTKNQFSFKKKWVSNLIKNLKYKEKLLYQEIWNSENIEFNINMKNLENTKKHKPKDLLINTIKCPKKL